ncbi:MAG: hypothetical protein ABFD08_17675 [Syntrophomonas sp.]
MNSTNKSKRIQRKINELGRNAKCQICGETDLTMLTSGASSLLEEHHIAGHHEGDTITLCLNCHHKLTDPQLDWPSELFDDERSPEKQAIAFFMGIGALLGFLAFLCVKHATTLLNYFNSIQEVNAI